MPKVPVMAEVSERHLRAYEDEARRRGVSTESLVEQTVNTLLRDLEREEEAGLDAPITQQV